MFVFHQRIFSTLLGVLIFFCLQPAYAATLSFETLLVEAKKYSFDLKIARENVQASQAAIGEARADYYPKVSLRFGNEYVHAFKPNGDVVSVGDAIIADTASGYKHSLIFGIGYNLFDFGVRRLTVESALRQVQINELQEKQSFRDVAKELLSHYSSALKLQKRICAAGSIFQRQKTLFSLSGRLRQAGTVGREQVSTAALNLAETLNQLEEMKLQYQAELDSLSIYTRKPYSGAETQLSDLAQMEEVDTDINLEATPELQAYQQEIENKIAELSIVKRSLLPKLTLNGAYRMFGSDQNSFADSLSSLSSRDASLTVYLEWPLFSGFDSRAKIARLEHELTGLRYRKQKKEAEMQKDLSSLVNNYATYTSTKKNRQQQLIQIAQEQSDTDSLVNQQVIDQVRFNNKLIQLLNQRLEIELRQVDFATSAQALIIMNKAVP